MSLDGDEAEANADVMAIVNALLDELDGRPRKAVSDALGLEPAQATRILQGKRLLYPHEIATIERAWKLPLGTILRRAGLVDDAVDVRAAIAGDVHLLPAERRIVLRTYDNSVAASQDAEASSTTVRRTRRS